MAGQPDASAAGTIDVGGDLTVNRMGFGAMRITGQGIWGPPANREQAQAALRRAVELGVNFIDTADSYGPDVSETLIADTLYPYPAELVIATKGGLVRPGPGRWQPDGRPGHLREAQRLTPVVSVQNRYNLADRSSEPIVDLCDQEAIAFLPWAPIQNADRLTPVLTAARRHGVSIRQIALAWLLTRSAQILPIPGSGSPEHVAENIAAASIQLSSAEENAILDVAG